MSQILEAVLDFVKSLNLGEKLSPMKNKEIIWFYLFLPALILYVSFLSDYLNKKPIIGKIEVFDPLLSKYVNPNSQIEVIAKGLKWSEGPVWMKDDSQEFLLFSDSIENKIYKWEEGKGLFTVGKTIYQEESGCYTDLKKCELLLEPGSNGLLPFVNPQDSSTHLLGCLHGERGVGFIHKNGSRFMIATHYKGNPLNSPNDLVRSFDGHIYFTDPTYGLSKKDGNFLDKSLNHSGVYMIKSQFLEKSMMLGQPTTNIRLVENKLTYPNGLAFSPDYSKLYISNSDPLKPYLYVYNVTDEGTLQGGKIFFNFAEYYKLNQNLPDGLKVDIFGNIFATGPGGVFIFAPEGKLLGRIFLDSAPTNIAFGGDGRLYITVRDFLARVRVLTKPNRLI